MTDTKWKYNISVVAFELFSFRVKALIGREEFVKLMGKCEKSCENSNRLSHNSEAINVSSMLS